MRRARAGLVAVVGLVAGCSRYRPPYCEGEVNPGWTPETTTETRLDEATVTWEGSGQGAVDPAAADGCPVVAPCLTMTGPARAEASMVLNRGVPHTLTATVTSEQGARLLLQHERESGNLVELAAVDVPAGGPTEVELPFQGDGFGGEAQVVLVTDAGTATLDELLVTAETWSLDPDPDPPGLLHLGFLIHVEQDQNFTSNEETWRIRARVIEGLAATLAAHGTPLGFQPDATFVRGATAWEPGWLDARAAEGVGYSIHIHAEAEEEAEQVEAAVRDARAAFREGGYDVTDLNGGFGSGPWAMMDEAGVRSLTGYKEPATGEGLALAYTQPWRPADGASAPEEFAVDDPEGPLVYLPGAPLREDDFGRVEGFTERVVSQARAHTRADGVNTWYFVLHVDGFGPGPDDPEAAEAYVSGGELAADLALWDATLSDVLDPLVEAGEVRYAVPDQMAGAWLDWEEGCR